jgi:hypothetical protein
MFLFALWFRFRTKQSSSQPSPWPTVPFVPPQSSCGLMPTWCVLQEPRRLFSLPPLLVAIPFEHSPIALSGRDSFVCEPPLTPHASV